MAVLDRIITESNLRYHLTGFLDDHTDEVLNLYRCKKWDLAVFYLAKHMMDSIREMVRIRPHRHPQTGVWMSYLFG